MTYHKPSPEMVPLPRAPAIFGLSRSHLYRLAAEGRIRLLKAGARTLVDCASVRAFLATLPEASIGKRDAA
ncbi:helix-turn-helix domain-containing protein [Roseomonas fluvialis]|uniref:Helix-turn-helix domain-containing protein n=1 Tax=Roseomonas fluvialis TaxID=1750527 RepID=A0ABM7Y7S1_9PROT|nr:helix-turn-helix domain-containing protein [Roseomonas fluvialis]BDG74080.1 hypothetical protein Rmf_40090 [Roseomonas fluvialis]